MRVIKALNKFVKIDSYCLEDVAIDIRALTDGYKPYSWQYQKSNRLDANVWNVEKIIVNWKYIILNQDGLTVQIH